MKLHIRARSSFIYLVMAVFMLSAGVSVLPARTEAATIETSSNWSGYMATDSTYTGVGGTWVVPTVSANEDAPISADATWVGIGGSDTGDDLIQAGTQALTANGKITYEAWFETLPQDEQTIPLAIHPGDSVTANLTETSPGEWKLVFVNNTTGLQYATTIAYASSHSSAEWVEEMPTQVTGRGNSLVALDQFGTATFTNAYAIADGARATIAQTNAQPITMVESRAILVKPSGLNADGTGFSVTRSNDGATVDSGNGVRTRRIQILRSSRWPSSLNPSGVTSTYTTSVGNGYRIVRVQWSY